MDDDAHIEFLDSLQTLAPILAEYQPLYHKLLTMKRQLNALERSEQERLQRLDLLSFHLEEIEGAELVDGGRRSFGCTQSIF